MKRRDFLEKAALVLPVLVNGLGVKSFGRDSALVKSLNYTQALGQDRVLVVIYLNGGNDGLNTVVPLEYYSQYGALRPNLALPESSILRLNNYPETGFHPAMGEMRNLFNEGKLGVIHSVSYPNPSLSHYRSSEIWMTGSDSNQHVETGWSGRYLEHTFPEMLSDDMMDPLAIQIGYTNSTTLLGSNQPMGVAIPDVETFYQLTGSSQHIQNHDLPCCDAGELVKHFRQQQVLSIAYSNQIRNAASAGRNLAEYPVTNSKNDISEQLKIVSKLIHGGLRTKIYYLEMMGFDTHAEQVSSNNTAEGNHAVLLKKLSEAIGAFQKDLSLLGIEDKVLGMTFSDFGRRATSNSSRGTDHGIGAPMFVFGTGLKRQMIGSNPDLINDLIPPTPNEWDPNQDVKMQIDFRRVYADIIDGWFGAERHVANNLLMNEFDTLSLFSDTVETIASGSWIDRNIWTNNRIPSVKDKVRINVGHVVQVGEAINVKTIQVNGKLEFLNKFDVQTAG